MLSIGADNVWNHNQIHSARQHNFRDLSLSCFFLLGYTPLSFPDGNPVSPSAFSWAQMYCQTCSKSNPTLNPVYPRAQRCSSSKLRSLPQSDPAMAIALFPFRRWSNEATGCFGGIAIPIGHDPETNALPKSGILSALTGNGKSFLRGVGIAQTRLSAASSGSIQHGICNPTSDAIDFHKIV